MNKIIEQIENAQLKSDVPEFGSGDTLVVPVSYTHLTLPTTPYV